MAAHRIVRNVFSNWMGLAVNIVAAFLMSPFLVHRLGDTMYGLWVLLLSVTGYMGLLDAGLKVSVVKYVSRYSAVDDNANLNRVVSTVLGLYTGIGVLVFMIALAVSPLLPRLFTIPPDVVPTARFVLLITAGNLAISLLMSVFNGVLAGLQRYDYANVIGVCLIVVRSLIIVLVISQGYGIVALGLVHTFSQVVGGLLLAWCVFRELPNLRIGRAWMDTSTVRALYGYSLFVLLNNVAMLLLFSSAEVLIAMFIGAAAVTYYAIAGSLLQYLSKLIGVMTQVLHPYASAQEAKGDVDGLKRTVILGTKVCMLIALPATVTFMIAGKSFIGLWMGPTYAAAAGPLLIALAVGRLFWLSQSSTGNVLLGVGRHKLLTAINLATGVASILFGIALIGRMGLAGLVLGMAVPVVISHGLILPRLTLKILDIPAREYWREAYLKPTLAVLPYVVVLAGLMRVRPPGSLLELAAVAAVAMPALLVPVFFICFTARQRRAIWQDSLRWLPHPVAGGSQ
jgi:O-antigen/teichoic acid export membrane protein